MLIKRLLSLCALPRNQTRELGPRIGSMYIAASSGISGVLTYVFQGMSARFLGPAEFGALAILGSATLLLALVLGVGITHSARHND
jgi:O-antigen/teichoic acid export membrane protein